MTDLRRTPLRRLLLLSALMGGASLVEDTATGNPVTFETDVSKPLVSLIANFLPVQTGSGDPSPDNIRPITGWTGVTVNHGADQTDYDTYPVTWTSEGTVYGGYVDLVTGEVWATWEAIEKTWEELKINRDSGGYQEGRANFVNPIPVSGESGASATYQKCNIAKYSWQDFDGTAHFYTAKVGDNYRVSVYLPIGTDDSTEIVVVCKLKSPVLITTLTPQQINAIKGNNTIWSDANSDCSVTFLKKGT